MVVALDVSTATNTERDFPQVELYRFSPNFSLERLHLIYSIINNITNSSMSLSIARRLSNLRLHFKVFRLSLQIYSRFKLNQSFLWHHFCRSQHLQLYRKRMLADDRSLRTNGDGRIVPISHKKGFYLWQNSKDYGSLHSILYQWLYLHFRDH